MAEAFLEEIYQYAKVITAFKQVVRYLRIDDFHHAKMILIEEEEKVRKVCKDCQKFGGVEAIPLRELILHVYQSEKDSIVRADIIENAIVPMLEKWVQSLGSISQQVDEEYQLESTASGFLTMRNLRTNIYLHSNNNPMEEARKQIEFFYVPSTDEYAVLGCGLGYHVYQLYQVSNGSVKIYLYESDKKVIEYAKKYGVLDWVPEDILEIITEDSVFAFLTRVNENKIGAFMHYPSLQQIRDTVERNAVIQSYGEQHTELVHKRDFQINFWRNIHSGAHFINELNADRVKEEVVVVAAGPSLDDFLETLRDWQGKKTIIVVGTVFAKLVKQGIRPDFVVIADPQRRTIKQIEGVEGEEIPMVLDTCAYFEFARKYRGEKYLVLSPQVYDMVEYAKNNSIRLWQSGGTVTSLAVEMAVKFHAKKIYLAGVDFAYPDGVSHAFDTMDRKVGTTEGMMPVDGVLGQTVYTTPVFHMYLQWLENCITCEKQITWYNLSTRGARIKGTIEIGDQILNRTFIE